MIGVFKMIITTTGKYPIIPITCYNKIGNPYRLRVAEITTIDKDNHKIYCPDFGWIDWNLPVAGEKRGGKKR
jgi:hypothetical protein